MLIAWMSDQIDDSAKGLTQFSEHFTIIPSAPKYIKCQQHCYLKTFGSEIENKGSLKVEEAIL